jgi:transportin-3
LIIYFVETVTPYVEPGEENPAVKYCQEIFPVLAKILETFIDFYEICERICRTWRCMIISYRTAMAPLLPEMANKLASGFTTSKMGCFLWVTSSILSEFSGDREHVDAQTTHAIYAFFEAQATAMLRMMNNLPPKDLPDVIDDFYYLLIDTLHFYTQDLTQSELFAPIFQAAIASLALEQRDPLCRTLHYIRDVIDYGGSNPPRIAQGPNSSDVQQAVQQVLLTNGPDLVKAIMAGMMITFPDDCFTDGSGALLNLFELLPQQTTNWVDGSIKMLPPGTISDAEIDRLMNAIRQQLSLGPDGVRKVRSLLQDFTNNYRRRYVAPRDGLGGLEATRFRFTG